MTASEQLWAKAEERANAPEHIQDVLALFIDQNTVSVARSLNKEIGHGVMCGGSLPVIWQNHSYAEALHRYAQLKIRLHRTRKHFFNDWLQLDETASLEAKCKRLRQQIMDAKDAVMLEMWGIS